MNTAQAYGAYGAMGGMAVIGFLLPAGIALYVAPNATVGAIAGGLAQQQTGIKFLGSRSDDYGNMLAAGIAGGLAGAAFQPWSRMTGRGSGSFFGSSRYPAWVRAAALI